MLQDPQINEENSFIQQLSLDEQLVFSVFNKYSHFSFSSRRIVKIMKKWGYIKEADSKSSVLAVSRTIRSLSKKGLVDVIVLSGSNTGRGCRYKRAIYNEGRCKGK